MTQSQDEPGRGSADAGAAPAQQPQPGGQDSWNPNDVRPPWKQDAPSLDTTPQPGRPSDQATVSLSRASTPRPPAQPGYPGAGQGAGYGSQAPAGYSGSAPQAGYGSTQASAGYGSTPQPGYEATQAMPGYGSQASGGYGSQAQASSGSSQGGSGQGQPGYGSTPAPPGYGTSQPGYGTSQPAYGSQGQAGYGSQGQQPGYAQPQPPSPYPSYPSSGQQPPAYGSPYQAYPGGGAGYTYGGDPTLAEWWRRFLGYLIDAVVLAVIYVILQVAIHPSGIGGSYLLLVILCVITFIYYAVQHALWGRTLGKRALGTIVVTADSRSKISGGAAAGRAAVYALAPIVYFIGSIFVLIDVLWLTWDPRKQALHDKAAKTIVVKTSMLGANPYQQQQGSGYSGGGYGTPGTPGGYGTPGTPGGTQQGGSYGTPGGYGSGSGGSYPGYPGQ